MSRKKCKRKHYDYVNPIQHAIEGACITSDELLNLLRKREKSMIESLVNGTNEGLSGYRGLCEMLGVAETMGRNGIGHEVLPACEAAQNALISLKNRFDKWSKWDILPIELHALNELYEWHDLQRSSISRGEYEKFLKNATNRMRSRAPEVVEI